MKRKLFITLTLLVIISCSVIIFLILTAPLNEADFNTRMSSIYDSVQIGDLSWAEDEIFKLIHSQNLENRHKRILIRLCYSIYHQGGRIDYYLKNTEKISSMLSNEGFAQLFYIDALIQDNQIDKAVALGESALKLPVFDSVNAYLYKLAQNNNFETSISPPEYFLSYTPDNDIESLQSLAKIMNSEKMLHNSAVKMLQDNYIDQAVEQLRSLNLNESIILQSRLLLDKGYYSEALRTLDKADDIVKIQPEVLAIFADIALETGDYELLAGIEEHIEYLSIRPRSESKLNRFYISLINGDLELISHYAGDVLLLDTPEAYKAVFRASKQYPDLWDITQLYKRAGHFKDPGVDLLYLELTKFQDTALIPRLWQYFWDFPEDVEVPRYLSYLLFRTGDFEELAVMLEKVPEALQTTKWYTFFNIWLKRDVLEVDELMHYSNTAFPWYTSNLLASIALNKGYISTAEKLLLRAINDDSKSKTPRINAELQFNLAVTLLHKNNFDPEYAASLLQASDRFISLRQRADKIKALLESR